MRKGYIHALEGVIAALVVVMYLTQIVSVPEPTDWTRTRTSKQSEDLMSALDRSGVLDDAVLRNDPETLNAFINALDSSAGYQMRLRGLPQSQVSVGVLVNNSSTVEASTTPGDHGGTGLPVSYSGYRQGSLSTAGLGDVPFVLSDEADNNITAYTSVSFDFDGDSDFGEPGEGPHRFGERFDCAAGVSGCSGGTYSVGPFNTTLVLYNGSFAEFLAETESDVSIGRRDTALTYETTNRFHEELTRFDALVVHDWTVSEIAEHGAALEDYIAEDRFVLLHTPVVPSAVDGNYLSQLGFDYIQQYRLQGSGDRSNVLYSLHSPGNLSYRPDNYYIDSAMSVSDFSPAGGYDEAAIEIRETDITVRSYGDRVAIGSEDFGTNYTPGDQVVLQGNRYTLEGVDPLVLNPEGQQRFASFDTERIAADYYMTRMRNYGYNITAYDTNASYTVEISDGSDSRLDGTVGTPCDTDRFPYGLGNITVDGTEYTFAMVNFELDGSCSAYYEYVYLDLNDDGDFNDGETETAADFSGEGPFQKGDVVEIDNRSYEVLPYLDGNGTTLERVGPRLVGEVPVSRDVVEGSGSVGLVVRQDLGDDDVHLLTALLAYGTQQEVSFTDRRVPVDISLGYTYSSRLGEENPLGYTIDSVWWSQ